jgi:hypothetical protein
MVFVFFTDIAGRRRGGRWLVVREGSRDLVVFFILFRVLCELWLTQLPLYPISTFLYLYVYMYVFLIQ